MNSLAERERQRELHSELSANVGLFVQLRTGPEVIAKLRLNIYNAVKLLLIFSLSLFNLIFFNLSNRDVLQFLLLVSSFPLSDFVAILTLICSFFGCTFSLFYS